MGDAFWMFHVQDQEDLLEDEIDDDEESYWKGVREEFEGTAIPPRRERFREGLEVDRTKEKPLELQNMPEMYLNHPDRNRIFYDCTRFTYEEFEELARNNLYVQEYKKPFSQLGHLEKAPSNRNKKLDARQGLWVFLRILSGDLKQQGAAYFFNISQATVCRVFYHVVKSLSVALKSEIAWPNRLERGELASKVLGLNGMIGVIDGTRVNVGKPSAESSLSHSGKTQSYCTQNQVVVDIYGRFIDVEAGMNGSNHDKLVYENSKIGKAGNERKFFDQGQYLIGDPGYFGCGEEIVPVPSAREVKENDRTLCWVADIIRRHRIVVEYSIGIVKRTFPLAGCPGTGTYRLESSYFGLTFWVSCALMNRLWRIRQAPPRGEDYLRGQYEKWEEKLLKMQYDDGIFAYPLHELSPSMGILTPIVGAQRYLSYCSQARIQDEMELD